ncbi:MAG TPA: hypothetical protein VMT22_16855, partial [Terriglobales bacterium]|nr:hypothetical protein [Terriglobales bacterium]
MNKNHKTRPKTAGLVILVLSIAATNAVWSATTDFNRAWGTRYRARQQVQSGRRQHGNAAVDWIKRWNEIAINASGLDHTPVAPGETRVFGEQLGPGRSSRAMAIVHIAIFEAVNAIAGGYESYLELAPARGDVSLLAAVATAAHDTLSAMYPSQQPAFDNDLAMDLAKIAKGQAKTRGMELGRRAAAAILALRADDGAQHAEPRVGVDFITSDQPGKWRQDPVSLLPLALGAHWGEVDTFVLRSADQFRAPVPPAITSAAYAQAYAEAKRLGGDGMTTPTERTAEQTEIGIYWA